MTILYNTLVHGISWIIPLIELLNYVFIQSKWLSWYVTILGQEDRYGCCDYLFGNFIIGFLYLFRISCYIKRKIS